MLESKDIESQQTEKQPENLHNGLDCSCQNDCQCDCQDESQNTQDQNMTVNRIDLNPLQQEVYDAASAIQFAARKLSQYNPLLADMLMSNADIIMDHALSDPSLQNDKFIKLDDKIVDEINSIAESLKDGTNLLD